MAALARMKNEKKDNTLNRESASRRANIMQYAKKKIADKKKKWTGGGGWR